MSEDRTGNTTSRFLWCQQFFLQRNIIDHRRKSHYENEYQEVAPLQG